MPNMMMREVSIILYVLTDEKPECYMEMGEVGFEPQQQWRRLLPIPFFSVSGTN
jgi:hypothetical protein